MFLAGAQLALKALGSNGSVLAVAARREQGNARLAQLAGRDPQALQACMLLTCACCLDSGGLASGDDGVLVLWQRNRPVVASTAMLVHELDAQLPRLRRFLRPFGVRQACQVPAQWPKLQCKVSKHLRGHAQWDFMLLLRVLR